MANRQFAEQVGSVKRGVVKLYGKFTTTAAGALSAVAGQFTPARAAGFTLVKTAAKTGRYTVTLQDKYVGLLALYAVCNGAADAAYTTAKGLNAFPRNVNVNPAGTTAPTFDIQFARTDTAADAEVEDAAVIYIEITLDNSSV